MIDLGQKLREVREAQGTTLEQIQQQTRIQKRYLAAIEEGRYEILPGEFYVKAFIRQYAEALGISKEELIAMQSGEPAQASPEVPVEQVETTGEQVAEPVQKTPSRREEVVKLDSVVAESTKTKSRVKGRRPRTKVKSRSQSLDWIPRILTAIVVLGIVIAAWFLFQNRAGNLEQTEQPPAADNTGINGAEMDEPEDSPLNHDQAENQEDALADEEEPAEEEEDTPAQTITQGETSGNLTLFTVENAEELEVKITWTGTAYVDVTNNAGAFLFMGQKDAGHEEIIHATDESEVTLNIGNVTNVTVEINGEKVEVPNVGVHQRLRFTRVVAEN